DRIENAARAAKLELDLARTDAPDEIGHRIRARCGPIRHEGVFEVVTERRVVTDRRGRRGGLPAQPHADGRDDRDDEQRYDDESKFSHGCERNRPIRLNATRARRTVTSAARHGSSFGLFDTVVDMELPKGRRGLD